MSMILSRRALVAVFGGAVATWPLLARGQQSARMRRIGVLWHAGSAAEEGEYYEAFRQGFRDLGYVEGQTIAFEHRFPNDSYERFKALAAELVALKVDVLVCVTQAAVVAARDATNSIPIVFISVVDPVGSKLVHSLARPGANITGFSNMAVDLVTKRLQILKETVPSLTRAAFLVNPGDANAARRSINEAQTAAGTLNVSVQPYEIKAATQLEQTFAAIAKDGMHGIFVANDPVIFDARKRIADLALVRRLPLLLQNRPGAEAGALMSYGTDGRTMFRRAPLYIDKILKGANAGDLPIEQPTKFEFIINLKTARTLGLDIPATLIARADDVIE